MIKVVKDDINHLDIVVGYKIVDDEQQIGYAELVNGYFRAYVIDDNYVRTEIGRVRANHIDDVRELLQIYQKYYGNDKVYSTACKV